MVGKKKVSFFNFDMDKQVGEETQIISEIIELKNKLVTNIDQRQWWGDDDDNQAEI